MCKQFTLGRIYEQPHIATNLGNLGDIGGYCINWTSQCDVIKVTKAQFRIKRNQQWLNSIAEEERTKWVTLLRPKMVYEPKNKVDG